METIVTSVLATQRQEYGLSKANSDLTASKKHTVKSMYFNILQCFYSISK
jgi:hypothetical protein